jgi:hypothetical protein
MHAWMDGWVDGYHFLVLHQCLRIVLDETKHFPYRRRIRILACHRSPANEVGVVFVWANYTYRQTDIDGCMDGSMDGWTDGCREGWMDGCMDGWMDGWMNAPSSALTSASFLLALSLDDDEDSGCVDDDDEDEDENEDEDDDEDDKVAFLADDAVCCRFFEKTVR